MPARIASVAESLAYIRDGARIVVGGAAGSELPVALLTALARNGAPGRLTVIIRDGDLPPHHPLISLMAQGRVRRLICTPFSGSPAWLRATVDWQMALELIPEATLAECLRAGGAGLAAVYTPVGAAEARARGDEVREFDGQPCVLARALRADVALLRAERADELGNLAYPAGSPDLVPLLAAAADLAIAEVGHLLPRGGLDPATVATPHTLVHLLVLAPQPASGPPAPAV